MLVLTCVIIANYSDYFEWWSTTNITYITQLYHLVTEVNRVSVAIIFSALLWLQINQTISITVTVNVERVGTWKNVLAYIISC